MQMNLGLGRGFSVQNGLCFLIVKSQHHAYDFGQCLHPNTD